MIGFRVQLNQNQALTVGLEGRHVLSVTVTSSERDPDRAPPGEAPNKQRLAVHGLQTGADGPRSHLSWLENSLKVGDTVTVQVVETTEAEILQPRKIDLAKEREKFERQQLRQLLEKYGTP
jgi:hypothetical protein